MRKSGIPALDPPVLQRMNNVLQIRVFVYVYFVFVCCGFCLLCAGTERDRERATSWQGSNAPRASANGLEPSWLAANTRLIARPSAREGQSDDCRTVTRAHGLARSAWACLVSVACVLVVAGRASPYKRSVGLFFAEFWLSALRGAAQWRQNWPHLDNGGATT